jgi:hypothetical protein
VAHRLAHPSHLTVAALPNRELQHALALSGLRACALSWLQAFRPAGGVASSVEQRRLGRQRVPAVERDALAQLAQCGFVGHARDAHFVGALDAVPRVRQARRQVAVVGEK